MTPARRARVITLLAELLAELRADEEETPAPRSRRRRPPVDAATITDIDRARANRALERLGWRQRA